VVLERVLLAPVMMESNGLRIAGKEVTVVHAEDPKVGLSLVENFYSQR
jgi:hypothetical protein